MSVRADAKKRMERRPADALPPFIGASIGRPGFRAGRFGLSQVAGAGGACEGGFDGRFHLEFEGNAPQVVERLENVLFTLGRFSHEKRFPGQARDHLVGWVAVEDIEVEANPFVMLTFALEESKKVLNEKHFLPGAFELADRRKEILNELGHLLFTSRVNHGWIRVGATGRDAPGSQLLQGSYGEGFHEGTSVFHLGEGPSGQEIVDAGCFLAGECGDRPIMQSLEAIASYARY